MEPSDGENTTTPQPVESFVPPPTPLHVWEETTAAPVPVMKNFPTLMPTEEEILPLEGSDAEEVMTIYSWMPIIVGVVFMIR